MDCSAAFATITPIKLIQKLIGLGLEKVCLQPVQWLTGQMWQHHVLSTGPQKWCTHWEVSSALCCPYCSPMTVLPTRAQLQHYPKIWRWHDQPGPHQRQQWDCWDNRDDNGLYKTEGLTSSSSHLLHYIDIFVCLLIFILIFLLPSWLDLLVHISL